MTQSLTVVDCTISNLIQGKQVLHEFRKKLREQTPLSPLHICADVSSHGLHYPIFDTNGLFSLQLKMCSFLDNQKVSSSHSQ